MGDSQPSREASSSPRADMAPSAPASIQPSSKASVAAPTVNSDVELSSVGDARAQPPPPAEDDIMHLARIGDIAGMERLFESGEYDATYADEEGITPLHWAAINNQYAMCKFLIDHGAEINKKGGESVATPLQWAAQRCHYYTVNLLLQHGADPLITDAQGYNTLHISTFNGSVLLIVLLLHQGIPVDVVDSYGHTGLMWSAYKGYPQCVDLFLRWGANVHHADEQGFTPLHWALVKGSPACIQKLIEYGADRFAKTETGKTPALTASELNTTIAWHRALRECGYDEDGHPVEPNFPGAQYLRQDKRGFITKFLFFWPFLMVWACLHLISGLPILLGILLTLIVGYALQWCAMRVLEYAPPGMRHIHKTPYLAGIFSGSLFLVWWSWIFTVFPQTTFTDAPSNPHWWLNILFAISAGLCTYFYAMCMLNDPGFVPKMNGIAEQKAVIDELLREWKFDEANFCVACMIRTPLRSKHCKQCQRCVAKIDHHCPWVYNCVAVNNHRHFFLYLITLTFGVILYDWLVYDYLTEASRNASGSCSILSAELCKVLNTDAYTAVLALWASLQLTWVSMLMFVQFVQVARAMTTFENMYGIRDSTATAAFTTTGMPLDPNRVLATADGGAVPAGHGHVHAHRHGHRGGGFLRQWSRLLGVEPFLETIRGRSAATGGLKNGRRRNKNPYSRGVVGNCRDFWCDPAPVFGQRENGSAVIGGEPINYTAIYESPTLMEISRGRRRGEYEQVSGTEEV